MRWLLSLFVVAVAGVLYIVSPFYAAWNLREAIKAADTATIERKVVWPSVRESLRASLAANSKLLKEANELGEKAPPTLWQRLKTALGSSMLDRFIESYVTPEGLPKLLRYRKVWNENVKGEKSDDNLPLAERISRFYKRITRAEFQSLTKVAIELAEKSSPTRVAIVMELFGTDWKLTSLQMLQDPPAAASVGSAPRPSIGLATQ